MDHLIQYAMSFVGSPYQWGGNFPISGYDCSGLVQEILASVGMDPSGDQTAQTLFNHFESRASTQVYQPGALAFYGQSLTKIIHIAFMIDNHRVIEAGGGGSHVNTFEDAKKASAFTRIRLVKHRSDFLITLKPQYSTIGLI